MSGSEGTDRYRPYEIPGAPHAGNGDSRDGTSSFPTIAFTRAAAARLARWAENGVAPPEVPRIDLTTRGDVSVAKNDEHGNALGGIRSPYVDVPLFRYEVHTGSGPLCLLSGTETLLGADVLKQLYDDVDRCMRAFTASLDNTIKSGFLLGVDRQKILATQDRRAHEAFATG